MIVKGIMNASDAVLAITHGASGIIISNSGGRTLEGSPATVYAFKLNAIILSTNVHDANQRHIFLPIRLKYFPKFAVP